MSMIRSDELLPAGQFGPVHYKRGHRHLFQDVYAWAGRYRTVRTAKGGNAFCYPEHIGAQMGQVFERLKAPDLQAGAARDGFLLASAAFLAELNAIHPFREGNGRAQLSFLHLVGDRAGRVFRLEEVRPDSFLPAMIQSFHGRLAPLITELDHLLA